MRKLSAESPGEPVCERYDWTQHPRGRQQPFCSGGLSFWPAHQIYRTEAPIVALWHMGSGKHPALMIGSANCSLVQVSGTRYLLPTPHTITATSFHWWQLCVGVSDVWVQEAKTEEEVTYTCSLVWLLDLAACLPLALPFPAGTEGRGKHPAVFTPAQRFPRGKTAAADPRSAQDQT